MIIENSRLAPAEVQAENWYVLGHNIATRFRGGRGPYHIRARLILLGHAADIGASVPQLQAIDAAHLVASAAHIVLPEHAFALLAGGKGLILNEEGAVLTDYRVGSGIFRCYGEKLYHVPGVDIWTVTQLKIGDTVWTIASVYRP